MKRNRNRGRRPLLMAFGVAAIEPPSRAYYTLDKYVSQEQYPRTHGVRGKPIKSYTKMVRPQILMEDGRPGSMPHQERVRKGGSIQIVMFLKS